MSILLTYRGDGLGARLCALINTIRLSHMTGIPYQIVWPELSNYTINNPRVIFSDDYIQEKFYTKTTPWSDLNFDQTLVSNQTKKQFLEFMADEVIFCVNKMPGLLEFLDSDPTSELGLIPKKILLEVGWHSDIRPQIDDLLATDMQDHCALHIRRGDLLVEPYNHLGFLEKYAPTVLYLEAVEALWNTNAYRKFVVFSDDREIVDLFKQRFPFCVAPTDIVKLEDKEPLQKDLLEILIMSCCGAVLAPHESAFSSVASLIGGLKMICIHDFFEENERILKSILEIIKRSEISVRNIETEKDLHYVCDFLLSHKRYAEAVSILRLFGATKFQNLKLLTDYVKALKETQIWEAVRTVDLLVKLATEKVEQYPLLAGFPIVRDAHRLAAEVYQKAAAEAKKASKDNKMEIISIRHLQQANT